MTEDVFDSAVGRRYLRQLAKEFPNRYAVITELINLTAILNLPKGTEHFISDVHGEYEAFRHILNNASGVIRDKVELLYGERGTLERLPAGERECLCTLIYYPEEYLRYLGTHGGVSTQCFGVLLRRLIALASFLSSKYTRSKVRKAIRGEFSFVIDELMHAKADEDNNFILYHEKIYATIIETGSSPYFIQALAALIKRLAVDRLHVVGDLFDRGAHPEQVIDLLMDYHHLDLQWGNHDVLWMGAYYGSTVCQATVVRNNVHYDNFQLLESGYGISLRPLALFAEKYYRDLPGRSAMFMAISVIVLKLHGEVILRNPEFNMRRRLLLSQIDFKTGTVDLGGKRYPLAVPNLPTVDPEDPYRLTADEQAVVTALHASFTHSKRLGDHVRFLRRHGSMYLCCNDNLLYHGCVPLNDDGTFARILCNGRYLSGRAYLDYCDQAVRAAAAGATRHLDFMWYLWCGEQSPLSGRVIKTFERTLLDDRSAWHEPRNPYYVHYYNEDICAMILREFGLDPYRGHIINGHTPIKVKDGEKPVRGNGRLLVIDGGFCRAYQKTTGIAGYTLIYNSHNLRLKAHRSFSSIADALAHNRDILSDTIVVEEFKHRRMVADTDDGEAIRNRICDLQALLQAYRDGSVRERNASAASA